MYPLVLCDSSYFYFDLTSSYLPFSNGWFHFRYTHALLAGGGEGSHGAASLSSHLITQESTFFFCWHSSQARWFFSRAIIEHLRTVSMESTSVGHERTEMTYNRSLKIWFLHQIITKNSVAAFLLHSYSGFFILSLWIKGRDWKEFWYSYLAYSIYIPWNQLAEPGVRVSPCFYDTDTLDSCFYIYLCWNSI